MIEMHSKYDNMHTNGMFYALFCINNHALYVQIACYHPPHRLPHQHALKIDFLNIFN